MIITIPNESLLLIGLLMLIFIPQLHLIFIFATMTIVENLCKMYEKVIKFTIDYILPILILYLLSLIFLEFIISTHNKLNDGYNHIYSVI